MERTPTFLMANLGSEVSQVFKYKNSNQIDMAKSSAERAYKIIDDFTKVSESIGGKEEIKILIMIINDLISVRPKLMITKEAMNTYFEPYVNRINL